MLFKFILRPAVCWLVLLIGVPAPRSAAAPASQETAGSGAKTHSSEPEVVPRRDVAGGRVTLTIDDPSTRDHLEAGLVRRIEETLADLDVSPPADSAPPWKIQVEVRGFSRTYAFSVTATRAGEPDEPHAELVSCPCTNEELRGEIEAQIRQRVAELRASSSERPPKSAIDTPPPAMLATSTPTPPIINEKPRPRGGIGAPGIVAIAAFVGGAVLTPFGAISEARGDQHGSNPQFTYVDHHKTPASTAALGIGVSLLGASIILIAIDQAVCKPRPNGCRVRRKHDNRANAAFSIRF